MLTMILTHFQMIALFKRIKLTHFIMLFNIVFGIKNELFQKCVNILFKSPRSMLI